MLVQSYRPGFGASLLTKDQTTALTDVTPALIRQMPVDVRMDLAFRLAELKAQKTDAFWNAVQAFAVGVLPILAFFGVTEFVLRKRK